MLGAEVRRVSVRTGVCDEEALGPLPGDEFIAHPMVEWTRGLTVRADPERVWPWLVPDGVRAWRLVYPAVGGPVR